MFGSKIIPVAESDFIIFGATGDLARRKILPALYQRFCDGQISETIRLFLLSRREQKPEQLRESVAKDLQTAAATSEHNNEHNKAALPRFLACLHPVRIEATSTSDRGWQRLKRFLQEERVRVFYLATAPSLFAQICCNLGQHGLVSQQTRLVVEKPVGSDLRSSHEINAAIESVFEERQIYRIDHYLGKESVQNLMALRFANTLFEPLWSALYIDHIQITVAETDGIARRASYYDRYGAMRDMVQNHLLQLLCLIAMEPPYAFDADCIRDEKHKVLRSLCSVSARDVVVGQYIAGVVGQQRVGGYTEDLAEGVREESATESFVALKVGIGNWRWSGVPFFLRTGKRLAERLSEIVVCFKSVSHALFPKSAGELSANKLVVRLQPNEGLHLTAMIKDPGPGGMRLRPVPMDMTFAETFKVRQPDAYERLLMDVVRGQQTLFMRHDEVDAAWSWVDPILEALRDSGRKPSSYRAGSWGPSGSAALIGGAGRAWHEDMEK